MVNGAEAFDETLLDFGEFLEGDVAVVELAVHESGHEDFVNDGFDSSRGWILQGSDGAFDTVAQHEDGRFSRTRLGAGISKFGITNFAGVLTAGFGFLGRQGVEVFDDGGSVVLGDEVVEDGWQAMFAGEGQPVFDVGEDDQEAHSGC